MSYNKYENGSILKRRMRETNTNMFKKIMYELFDLMPNPRYSSLMIFLQINYPDYATEEDCELIWENYMCSDEKILELINE